MPIPRKEILEDIQECLVDALGVDKSEITEEASLTEDLGAESIDFLDIVFRMEKKFGIKVSREELFPAETILTAPEHFNGDKLTQIGIAALKEKLPKANFKKFEANPDTSFVVDLYTVGHLVDYVEKKLW